MNKSYFFHASLLIVFLSLFFMPKLTFGQNPINRHLRTADPSPHVWADGKMWLYCSHDMDSAQGYNTMDGYHVFSSSDMVNWTDHGEVLHSRDVKWGIKGGGSMWAPDCAYRNGTYYFYYPHLDSTNNWRVGVATSTKPEGPFKDIGRFIEGTFGIDPCCFIDDDGQAYLYFDKNSVAKLKENMTELAEPARKINYGATNSREGTYMHKRNNIYYFSYTDFEDQVHQGFYAMGNNPYGPFEFKGPVNCMPKGAQDHHAIVEFHGQWYYFYHTGNYNGGNWSRRNVCVDYLYYNTDGTMQMVKQTDIGVKPVKYTVIKH